MMWILITISQLNNLPTSPDGNYSLSPAITIDGRYVFPASILSDSNYAYCHEYLSKLPIIDNVDMACHED